MAALPLRAEERLNVVASFSILGDLVKNVGGDRVNVATLVGPNGDVHVYTPAPSDAKKNADAKLLVINGLGLEGWLPRLVQSAGSKATIVTASERHRAAASSAPMPIRMPGSPLPNVKIYVANIRDALIAADPADAAVFRANADRYLGEAGCA